MPRSALVWTMLRQDKAQARSHKSLVANLVLLDYRDHLQRVLDCRRLQLLKCNRKFRMLQRRISVHKPLNQEMYLQVGLRRICLVPKRQRSEKGNRPLLRLHLQSSLKYHLCRLHTSLQTPAHQLYHLHSPLNRCISSRCTPARLVLTLMDTRQINKCLVAFTRAPFLHLVENCLVHRL